MTQLTKTVNLVLVALVFAMPFVLQHGCAKQERMEEMRIGQ